MPNRKESGRESLQPVVIQYFCVFHVCEKKQQSFWCAMWRFLFFIYNSFISIAWNKNARSFHSNMDCICILLPCTNVCYFTNKHRFREYSKGKKNNKNLDARRRKKNIRLYIHSTFYDIWKKKNVDSCKSSSSTS